MGRQSKIKTAIEFIKESKLFESPKYNLLEPFYYILLSLLIKVESSEKEIALQTIRFSHQYNFSNSLC